ncbi:hypothetical protein F5Y16DRAFT_400689 [Xylariaceae sp. FL0255]|nr:hypothetical protein F5Y16DRAFT_400689 [Xylariaceae sp. FL0255]
MRNVLLFSAIATFASSTSAQLVNWSAKVTATTSTSKTIVVNAIDDWYPDTPGFTATCVLVLNRDGSSCTDVTTTQPTWDAPGVVYDGLDDGAPLTVSFAWNDFSTQDTYIAEATGPTFDELVLGETLTLETQVPVDFSA